MQNASPENKLRLLMIYASVYPEKFEDDKAAKIMQVTEERNLFLSMIGFLSIECLAFLLLINDFPHFSFLTRIFSLCFLSILKIGKIFSSSYLCISKNNCIY